MKKRFIVLIATLFIYGLIASPSFAYDITVGEIANYVNNPGNELNSYIAKLVEARLAQYNMSLDNGTLLFANSYGDTEIKDMIVDPGCVTRRPQIVITGLSVNAAAASSSNINLNVEVGSNSNLTAGLQGPIRAVATGYIYAKAKVAVPKMNCNVFGCFPYMDCVDSETWRTGFRAEATANMSATVFLELPAMFDSNQKIISITPTIVMNGEVLSLSNWSIEPYNPSPPPGLDITDVNRAIDEKVFKGFVDGELTSFLRKKADRKLKDKLEKAQADINKRVNSYLASQGATCIDSDNNGSIDKCTLTYQIPEIDSYEHVLDVLAAYLLNNIQDGAWLNPGYEYLRSNYAQLAFYALTGNQDGIRQLFLNAGTCVAINQGRVLNMPYTSLYQSSGGSCYPANLRAHVSGTFYLDSQCTRPIDYQETTLANYCTESLTPAFLGNADIWDGISGTLTNTPWTLMPSTQINVGVTKVDDNYQPFMKRVKYKTIDNAITNPIITPEHRFCKLEMRVYKKDIKGANLKPLLAVHGGSWSYRSFPFQGLESQISQFTERGYVVFSPFYRLTRSIDGPTACNNVTGREVLDDIRDALLWVQSHQSEYGGTGKISVFGQSAGAHLVSWLATQYPSQIEKALLLYPPVDAADYIDQLNQGNVPGAMGVSAIKGFLGDTSDDPLHVAVSTSDPFVIENSFPQKVEDNPSLYPPMFILHGASDTLVPSRQAVRMCNGLAGNANSTNGPAINDGGNPSAGQFSKSYGCGHKNSHLVLISQADHMFDACPTDILSKLTSGQVASEVADKICPAGSINSVHEAEKRLLESYNWLTDMSALMSIINSLLLN